MYDGFPCYNLHTWRAMAHEIPGRRARRARQLSLGSNTTAQVPRPACLSRPHHTTQAMNGQKNGVPLAAQEGWANQEGWGSELGRISPEPGFTPLNLEPSSAPVPRK